MNSINPSLHHCVHGTCPIHVRLFLLQSAQLLFPSNFRRLLIVCALRAVLSAAGSTCLRDISRRCRKYVDGTSRAVNCEFVGKDPRVLVDVIRGGTS